MKKFKFWSKRGNESGLAAIVVTGVLVSLLGITAVAFALVMNREATKSLDNQIGQAAYDAAVSGINDTISYLRDNPDASASQCNDLLGANKPLSGASNLSGDNSTQYTCVLLNPTPTDLVYQSIGADQNQVVRFTTSALMSKMMLSWQSTNRVDNAFVPSGQVGSLFDETTWSNNHYAPVLQVDFYPVAADSQSLATINSDKRTWFLYPTQTSAGSNLTTLNYATTASGTLQSVGCGTTNVGSFSGSADYDCNMVLSNLPNSNGSGYDYYVRVTPLYGAADFKLRANDVNNQALDFIHTQAIIDVTAQSAGAVKRLQARVDTSGLSGTSQNANASDNTVPPFAIQSPDTLCKRIELPSNSAAPVYIDPSTSSSCVSDSSISLPKIDPPAVTLNDPNGGYDSNGNDVTVTGSVDSHGISTTACTIHVTGTDGYDQTQNCSPFPGSGPSNVSNNFSSLTQYDTTYTVTMCASNRVGQTCAPSQNFDTPPTPCNSCDCGGDCGGGGGPSGCISVTLDGTGSTYHADDTPCGGPGLTQCNFYPGYGQGVTGGDYFDGSWPQTYDGQTTSGTNTVTCQDNGGNTGCGGDCGPQTPPSGPQITSFTATVYTNEPNDPHGYCYTAPNFPDHVHHYIVCMSWSSNNASYCQVVSSGGSGSGRQSPNGGYMFGYDNSAQAYADTITLTCGDNNGNTATEQKQPN